jgi:hypothetical protein
MRKGSGKHQATTYELMGRAVLYLNVYNGKEAKSDIKVSRKDC